MTVAMSKKGPIVLIVLGALLALGPMWGIIGTVIGMMRAFVTIGEGGASSPVQLSSDISLSLWSTAAGLFICPIGLGMLVGGIIWKVRANRPVTIPPVPVHGKLPL